MREGDGGTALATAFFLHGAASAAWSASMKLLDVETDPKMRSTSRIVASWLLRLRLAPWLCM